MAEDKKEVPKPQPQDRQDSERPVPLRKRDKEPIVEDSNKWQDKSGRITDWDKPKPKK